MTKDNAQALLKGIPLLQRAQALHAAGQLGPAADAYRQAMALMPNHTGLLLRYGELAEQVRDWKAAEQIFRRLKSVGDPYGIDGKLGHVLFQLERYDDACVALEAHLKRRPDDADALRLAGTCHMRMFRWDQALPFAERSWQLQKHPDTLSLMLSGLLEYGPRERLADLVELALREFPGDWQVRKLCGEHLLKSGDYRRGFTYFRDMRRSRQDEQHYVELLPVPAWDGKPFAGTLLVGAEQGIGDEIMAASMFPDILATGQALLAECDPRLLPLYRRSFPGATFVARNQKALVQEAQQRPDCRKAVLGDLFALLRTDPGRFPARAAWLQPDPEKVAARQARHASLSGTQPRIGLSWKSLREPRAGTTKDVALDCFRPLLARPDTAFISLQYGDIAADIAGLGSDARYLRVDPEVDTRDDIDTLAAQVSTLDLVITTSGTTAHVAGALGVPCWVLLPRTRPLLWYWGYAGERTPWYPSVRLWRNPDESDWHGFIRQIRAALDARLAAHS